MKRRLAIALFALSPLFAAMPAHAADAGLAERASPYPVGETLDRLEGVLRARGVKVFARIDHAGEASSAGLELRPMQLLIFGNPKAGTPMMQAVPAIGLDLPMKVLAWQDARGQVRVTWNSPAYLSERHGLDAALGKPLGALGGLLDAALK